MMICVGCGNQVISRHPPRCGVCKRCSRCGEFKSHSEFWPHRGDWLQSLCKSCEVSYMQMLRSIRRRKSKPPEPPQPPAPRRGVVSAAQILADIRRSENAR